VSKFFPKRFHDRLRGEILEPVTLPCFWNFFPPLVRNSLGPVTFPNERNQGKQAHPVLKYRVPHGSQPRPGWAPDPLMVGIRSPDGLLVGSCTSHPGVLGSIPKREEPVHTGLSSSSLVAHVLPDPPPPPCKQICTRSCSNKHTPSTRFPPEFHSAPTLRGDHGLAPQGT
jgi:hypothetical protein